MNQKIKLILINSLTILRIIGIPFFLILDGWSAFFLLNFLFLTDFLDGYFSRKYNLTSTFGAIMDLLGDKTLTIFLLILYFIKGSLNFWIVFLLVFRELYSIIMRFYYLKNKKGLISASFGGKLKTALMFISFDFLILNIPGYHLLFILVIIISYYSLTKYIIEGLKR